MSEQSSEDVDQNMSSVAEMTSLLRAVAAPTDPGEGVKAAIGRAARRLGLPWGRAKRLWYGEARRVDAWEMDAARRFLAARAKNNAAALRMEHARALDALALLEARLAAVDADFHCEATAALRSAVRDVAGPGSVRGGER